MSLSSQHHSFDISLASKYGIEEAIIIHHFQHWIRINQANGRNIKNGKCWSYQTRKEILDHFPYFTFSQIRRICERLIKAGILMTANYNKSQIDKTLWYAFVNQEEFGVDAESSKNLYERQNCPSQNKEMFTKVKFAPSKGKTNTPIPDTITDTKEKERKGPSLISFGKHVKLKEGEYEELVQKHSQKLVDLIIDKINDFIIRDDRKPYKDYAAAIRMWIRNERTTYASNKDSLIQKNREIALRIMKTVKEPGVTIGVWGDVIEVVSRTKGTIHWRFVVEFKEVAFESLVENEFKKKDIEWKRTSG